MSQPTKPIHRIDEMINWNLKYFQLEVRNPIDLRLFIRVDPTAVLVIEWSSETQNKKNYRSWWTPLSIFFWFKISFRSLLVPPTDRPPPSASLGNVVFIKSGEEKYISNWTVLTRSPPTRLLGTEFKEFIASRRPNQIEHWYVLGSSEVSGSLFYSHCVSRLSLCSRDWYFDKPN